MPKPTKDEQFATSVEALEGALTLLSREAGIKREHLSFQRVKYSDRVVLLTTGCLPHQEYDIAEACSMVYLYVQALQHGKRLGRAQVGA